MSRVAITQSNYIPWKGYFDMLNSVDVFVLYDDTQFTRRDWRNRNKIKSITGTKWLTIPVKSKGNYLSNISEILISDPKWGEMHWQTLCANYKSAPFFNLYHDKFERLYINCCETRLSFINYNFIVLINEILGIKTKIRWSSELKKNGGKTEKLLHMCRQLGSNIYVSGPSAKAYWDNDLAKSNNIAVEWMNYDDYPTYSQLHGDFDHNVTILDLIFNQGPNAKVYMKSFL